MRHLKGTVHIGGVALLKQLSQRVELEIFMRHLNGTVQIGVGLLIQLSPWVEQDTFMAHLKGTVHMEGRYYSYNYLSGL